MFDTIEGASCVPAGYYEEQAKVAKYHGNTINARLSRAVEEAETRLAEAKRAKEIFDAHPELEELINIMQKGRF
jgi:hypothetical protein